MSSRKRKSVSSNTASESSSAPKKTKPSGSSTSATQSASTSVNRRARVEDVDEESEVIEVGSGSESEGEPDKETKEQELARLQAKWTSPVYAFYRPEVRAVENAGRRAHEFHCAGPGCDHKTLRYLDTSDSTSTKNLRNHIMKCKCWGPEILAEAEGLTLKEARASIQNIPRSGSILAAFARPGKEKVTFSTRQHTRTETRTEIVCWVSESMRPFKIVKDRGFVNLMKTGRPHYWIPSPTTVSRDVKRVFVRVRARIAKMLQDHPGKLNFATDAWTSPNHRAYVAFTVHMEHDGAPLSFLLDIVEVAESHTGLTLAREFFTLLEAYGISNKLLMITTDNASSNDSMINSLCDLISDFPGEANHVRCFDHVVNLCAKSLLRPFDVGKQKDGETTLDDALQELAEGLDLEEGEMAVKADGDAAGENAEDEGLDDTFIDGIFDEVEGMDDEERAELEEEVRPVKLILVKLRKLAFATINSSTILLPAWHSLLERLDLEIANLPRDVRTRWNSTFTMLRFALEYRTAIEEFTVRNRELRKYELEEDEWEIVTQLRDVLKVYFDATQYFSRDKPCLSDVIPAMDVMDEQLTTHSLNDTLSPAIRAALSLSKKTLNRYYNKTDMSESYRAAMVLDPNYKLTYFTQADWPAAWIETARDIVRDEYNRNYANLDIADDVREDIEEQEKAAAEPTKAPVNMFDAARLRRMSAIQQGTPAQDDELEYYLRLPVEAVNDPIAWWHKHRVQYPRLSRMALDYLAAPATSVSVERVFSKGRILLSHIRNRLSAQSTRALLCLGQWSLLGLVADEDVLAVTKQPEVDSPETLADVADGWDRIVMPS